MDGIVSKERVKEFGEVFTPDTIVNNMLDLVDSQLNNEVYQYINTTYLEPSCGDGQFLIRILSRKLEKVQTLPVEQRQLALIKSLTTIYGVDIQLNNIQKARDRMFAVATGKEVSTFDLDNKTETIKIELGIEYSEQLINVINCILDKNIIHGDTLDTDNPIMLTDYKFNGDMVSTCECPLNDLTLEIDKQQEVYYLDLPNIKISIDTDDAEYDF